MDRKHGRQLNLQPGWTVLQIWREIIQHEWMWSCFSTSKSYCNARELSTWSGTKGIPCGVTHPDIIISKNMSPSWLIQNLWSFSLPFYTLTKASNVSYFSLKSSCTLYLICPHINMFTFHPYHMSTVQALESFFPLLTPSADVHVYHPVDFVSIFTTV